MIETILIVLGLLPINPHAVRVPDAEIAVAIDTAIAAESPEALPLPDAEQTSVLLVSIAHHESGRRADVANGRIRGALGEIGLWQVLPGPAWEGHDAAEIARSLPLQATLALHVLVRARKQGSTIGALCRAYTAGDARTESKAARDRAATFRRLIRGLEKKRN